MAVIEAIATQYLEADAASVTFSSLGSYEHLQLRYSAKEDATGNEGALGLRFNGDTGGNYTYHRMQGSVSTVSATGGTSQNAIYLYYCTTNGDNASVYGTTVLDILDYRNANKNTTVQCSNGNVGGGTSPNRVVFESGLWDNTAAVTSITLTIGWGSNIVRGSEFTLYGLNSS